MHKLVIVWLSILLLAACEKENRSFSGYVDTDLVYLSSDFGGRLTDLAVLKGQLVKSEQFLFKLEQTSELYNVQMSKLSKQNLLAQRQQILTQLNYNEINYRRIQGMRQQNAASQNDLDAAQRDLKISKDQLTDIDVKIHNNQIETSDKKWQMTRKENFAPERGIIFDTYHTQGEFVQAGAPVLSLITRNNIKAVFLSPSKNSLNCALMHMLRLKPIQMKILLQDIFSIFQILLNLLPPSFIPVRSANV